MASQFGRPGQQHLDATTGREVVFCHACDHEWYKDEQPDNESLVCPRCHGEATEIVSPENDPRSMNDDFSDGPDPTSPAGIRHRTRFRDNDSDPDEADIDDFRYPPAPDGGGGSGAGFFGRRSVYRGPERFPPPPFGGSSANRRTNPGDGADIIRSFQELLGDIGGPGGPVGPRPGQHHQTTHTGGPRHVTYQSFSGPNFTGGISSITITGPGSRQNRQPGALAGGDAEFQRVFGDIFRGPPLEHDGYDNNGQTRPDQDGVPGGPNRPLDLATALNQLFANLLNPHGTYGDGVYTQEALDRIITNLMEANPQSNAAAPASEEAIKSLVRKPLDKEALGGEPQGECTICIDDMLMGDTATFLPCKHWFHEECVVLWLKEHKTCPICRAPIDGDATGQPQSPSAGASTSASATAAGAAGPSSQPQMQTQQMPSFWSMNAPPAPTPPPDWTRPTWTHPAQSSGSVFASSSGSPREISAAERRRANLREHGSARLDALRDIGERDREQERLDRPSAARDDTSNSNSNNNSNSGGGGGPFSWFRDQFRDRRS
ncbi:hypothetical protein Micbo1qcDRAFT_192350 [Microdochium bolleyi]|uniref:RING-type E3 ubiquitin transferase n=1 Tax=Microdochium bolleyi TaxID=196109 RepID=A0A136JDQ2_9PEZI|nr:hypothetical protein Micbo1qcDRAFT_192350 [Microdochium bolleyi]